MCVCSLVLVVALLWYHQGDCRVAISGVCVCVRRGKPAAPSSLPYPSTLYFFLELSFSVFSAWELWDVDKSPDSWNNREAERKRK